MPLSPGARIGAYEITGPLGAGGMGEVYRARDTKLDREVAIKILPPEFATDAERVARFRREAKTLASINHPHIAHVHGLEETADGALAIVMELVEGEDLAQRLKRGSIPLDEALPIAKQIAEALEAAHEQGIIHRDLKPANIKVRDDGTIKVLDFGLAKAIDQGSGIGDQGSAANSPTITTPAMTLRGVILGTAAYMSPEQAKGKAVDRRTDIWAFGCVLYEMLTGHRPFEGEDTTEVLGAIVKTEPDWSRLPASTPSHLSALIRRCLQKDIRQRLPHIGVARQEIETPREAIQPVARLGTRAVWAAVGLAVGAAITFAALQPARPSSAPSRTMRLDLMPPADRPMVMRPGRLSFALSPDNTFLAYGTSNTTEIMVRYFNRADATPVAGTIGGRPISVSPDSKWVLFEGDRALKKVLVTGGSPVAVAPLSGPLLGASWGTDDRIYFTAGNANGVQSVSADGKVTQVTTLAYDKGDQSHTFPVTLPGRNALVLTVNSASGTRLELHDLQTGQAKLLVPGGSQATYLDAGYLVYVLGGSLWASRFDLARGDLAGTPVQIPDRVAVANSNTLALYAMSRAGMMVYVPRDAVMQSNERALVWVGKDGAEEKIPAPLRPYAYPRLSPDGTRIALSHSGDIWIWTLREQTLTRLTVDPGDDSFPLWSPDGQRVIFSSTRGGQANLWWQRADGTGVAQRLTESAYPQVPMGVSANGQLVLREERPTSRSLAVVALGGATNAQTILELPWGEDNADLSPDGHWLAYQSSEGGGTGDEVFVRPFPNVNGGSWQVSAGNSAKPRWSRDGRQLFFLSYATNTLSAVTVSSSGSSFSFGPVRPVVSDLRRYYNGAPARTWDVSLDSSRILLIEDAAGPQPTASKLVVVTNILSELTQP